MQRSLQKLIEDLSEFVGDADSEHMVVVFDVTDHEVPFILNALETVDAQHPDHVFLHFVHAIDDDVAQYMDALFASVRVQLDAVQAIRAAEELPPWPPLPSGCADVRKTPSDRIKLLLDYVHEQLADEESRIILGLLPSTIGDPAAYSQVVSGLLPKDEIEPWMNNTRVLLRDDREARFLTPYIETRAVDGVVFYEGLDFSPDAVASGILAAARNPESSDEERMMALVQLAAIDFAHKRYAESFRKWGVCYAYFTQTKVDSMRALCVCGAADALRDSGKLREAKEKYQQGIAFPPSQETLPTTLNLLLGVSRTCILLEEWTEAEGYLDLADKVASKLCQAYPKCEVMERQGFVLFKQKRLGEARIRWRAAVDISRELQAFDVAERALEQLIALFEHAQMRTEKSEHERELAEVRIAAKMFEREHLHS